MLTDLCGNRPFHNIFINTCSEIKTLLLPRPAPPILQPTLETLQQVTSLRALAEDATTEHPTWEDTTKDTNKRLQDRTGAAEHPAWEDAPNDLDRRARNLLTISPDEFTAWRADAPDQHPAQRADGTRVDVAARGDVSVRLGHVPPLGDVSAAGDKTADIGAVDMASRFSTLNPKP